jgi:hypothetical protein
MDGLKRIRETLERQYRPHRSKHVDARYENGWIPLGKSRYKAEEKEFSTKAMRLLGILTKENQINFEDCTFPPVDLEQTLLEFLTGLPNIGTGPITLGKIIRAGKAHLLLFDRHAFDDKDQPIREEGQWYLRK